MTAEHAHGIDTGRCICDGARYYTDKENAARYPFLRHSECPVHSKFVHTPAPITRNTAADAVLAEARQLCCGNNPSTHHEATAKHSERMAFAGDLARAVRGHS